MASRITERIRTIIKNIPRGRVASYGSIARVAGLANGARTVVWILHSSGAAEGLPWHRVVRKDGSIALPESEGFEIQRALLLKEGVKVGKDGRIDLARYACRDAELGGSTDSPETALRASARPKPRRN